MMVSHWRMGCPLHDSPGWDFGTRINLMVRIEQAFGVQFRGTELAEFQDIRELTAFPTSKGC
ncbi:MAG: phosphopantetheine-binding protein [Nitrospira sp.]|nr:phosphopantetheine-binding protein [Nitrospira sp.]MDH4368776.1 phosphopantetheine-binding protein [Nitrospira sp.]